MPSSSASATRIVRFSSYLDGKHCNKIAQLDRFAEAPPSDAKGVFLLDLDFVVLRPLEIEENDCVRGKIVDAPNPPLPVLEGIFRAAGVHTPASWPVTGAPATPSPRTSTAGSSTCPCPFFPRVRSAWREYGEFLHARPELFEHPSQRMHTDQVSFAMGLAAAEIPCRRLSANWNFPLHRPETPASFRPEEPVRGLHYHRRLDTFGLVDPAPRGNAVIDEAVSRVNAAIGAQDASMFFALYKRHLAREAASRVPERKALTFSDAFLARTRIGDRKRRLILHAGTPKTGTTALQWAPGDECPRRSVSEASGIPGRQATRGNPSTRRSSTT